MIESAGRESRAGLRARYRAGLPLLGAGTYAAIAESLPLRPQAAWWVTFTLALGALWLVPAAPSRRWQGGLGVYLFVAAIGLNLFLFSGPRSVPPYFRFFGWVAYALTWGGLRSADSASGEDRDHGLSQPPLPIEREPAPRRVASAWPFTLLLGLAFGLAALFLWPTGGLPPAKSVLLRTGILAFGVTLLRLASEVLGEVVLLGGRLPGHLARFLVGSLVVALALGAALGGAWWWAHGSQLQALAAATLAALLLGAVLRFRRFPRTKIEL
jgi:hypothetical protein